MSVRWMAVGDSLTQGMQSFGAAEATRPDGYLYQLARLAGMDENTLVPPRIADPGWPPQLNQCLCRPLTSLWSWLRQGGRPLRLNPHEQAHNLAIGGLTLAELLDLTVENHREVALTEIVRALTPAVYAPLYRETAVDAIARLQPETVFCWIGHNDVLLALFSNQPELLTPEATFQRLYERLLETLLQRTSARLVIATLLPYEGTPCWSYVRRARYLTDPDEVEAFLDCLPTAPGRGSPLDQLEAALERHRCRLNQFLRSLEGERVLVVDVAAAYEIAMTKGVPLPSQRLPFQLAGNRLTLAYPHRKGQWREGGLISLDGLHPSRTGYAFIAQWFAQCLREHWGWDLPSVDLASVAAHDPLLVRPPHIARLLYHLGMSWEVSRIGKPPQDRS